MTRQTMTADRLKRRLKTVSAELAEPSRVRIHRAISWLGRAEAETADPDARFIFLWIAFNAAYAREFGFEDSARAQLAAFFAQLLILDEEKRLAALMLTQFSGPVRTLIANKFVFEPFWKALREHDASGRWESRFAESSRLAMRSVLEGRTDQVLAAVFDRLYVLRNQLVHGGSTWSSRVNRAQVKDGASILTAVMPVVIELMLDHPGTDFGDILYPVIPV